MKRLQIVTEHCASSSGPGSLALVPIILTILSTHEITMLFLLGVKEEVGFNPALCELAGHLLIKGDLVCTFTKKHHVKVIYLLSFLFLFLEPPAYEVVTEKEVTELLDSITAPWFQRVGVQIPNLFSTTLVKSPPSGKITANDSEMK